LASQENGESTNLVTQFRDRLFLLTVDLSNCFFLQTTSFCFCSSNDVSSLLLAGTTSVFHHFRSFFLRVLNCSVVLLGEALCLFAILFCSGNLVFDVL